MVSFPSAPCLHTQFVLRWVLASCPTHINNTQSNTTTVHTHTHLSCTGCWGDPQVQGPVSARGVCTAALDESPTHHDLCVCPAADLIERLPLCQQLPDLVACVVDHDLARDVWAGCHTWLPVPWSCWGSTGAGSSTRSSAAAASRSRRCTQGAHDLSSGCLLGDCCRLRCCCRIEARSLVGCSMMG